MVDFSCQEVIVVEVDQEVVDVVALREVDQEAMREVDEVNINSIATKVLIEEDRHRREMAEVDMMDPHRLVEETTIVVEIGTVEIDTGIETMTTTAVTMILEVASRMVMHTAKNDGTVVMNTHPVVIAMISVDNEDRVVHHLNGVANTNGESIQGNIIDMNDPMTTVTRFAVDMVKMTTDIIVHDVTRTKTTKRVQVVVTGMEKKAVVDVEMEILVVERDIETGMTKITSVERSTVDTTVTVMIATNIDGRRNENTKRNAVEVEAEVLASYCKYFKQSCNAS